MTVRSRGRSSKSISTSCCQVPRASRPPITGTCSEAPISEARWWACELVSWLSRLCSYSPSTGTRRSSSARRSATPPGSNSIVVTAAVEPRTNAVTSPSATGPSATTRWTSAVMSMTSASPCVENCISPLCTAMARHASALAGSVGDARLDARSLGGGDRALVLQGLERIGDVVHQPVHQGPGQVELNERTHHLHVVGIRRHGVGGHHPAALGRQLEGDVELVVRVLIREVEGDQGKGSPRR